MQETLQQRLTATYAPDILLRVEIENSSLELDVSFEMDEPLRVLEGEYKRVKAWMSNAGSRTIGEVWVLAGPEDQIIFDSAVESVSRESPSCILLQIIAVFTLQSDDLSELFPTDNKLPQWAPFNVPLGKELQPSETTETLFTWRPISAANRCLSLLFIYREVRCIPPCPCIY